MNLIPLHQIYETGNYFCSWCTQGGWFPPRPDSTGDGCIGQRDGINEQYMFDDKGALRTFPQDLREDLLVVMDDGWDVPYHTHNPDFGFIFGSVEPDGERFASFGKDAKTRLCGISRAVLECGFAGLGLWISPQIPRTSNIFMPIIQHRRHFEEAAARCSYAGVKYWKVDWGWDCHEYIYRESISEACRKNAPHLLVEQTLVTNPLAVQPCDKDTPEYQKKVNTIHDLLEICDHFRTYDVAGSFEYVSTLMRLRVLFDKKSYSAPGGYRRIPNVEHITEIGAALGCSLGIMHHPVRQPSCAMQIRRALRWQRLAPPFGLDRSVNRYSEEILTDDDVFDTPVQQSSPAVFARNTALCDVRCDENGMKPFVVSSVNPITGAFSVATLPRTFHTRVKTPIYADITAYAQDPEAPIGIFGVYRSLTIVFERAPLGMHVYAQDAAADEASDITDLIQINGNQMTIDGKLIAELGSVAGDRDHPEHAALVISCRRENK